MDWNKYKEKKKKMLQYFQLSHIHSLGKRTLGLFHLLFYLTYKEEKNERERDSENEICGLVGVKETEKWRKKTDQLL